MIQLLVLALGLGAALAVYELSPSARARADVYIRAIQAAQASHQAADAHLGNAHATTATAARHAQQADAARQSFPHPFAPPMPVQPMPVQPMPVQPVQPVQPPVVSLPPPAPSAPPLTPPSPPVPAQDVAQAQDNAAQAAADAAIDHAAAALEENQAAARATAEAAKNAQTEAERRAAAQSAAKVLDREKKITAALASLGVGQCGVRSYPRATVRVKDALLAKLNSEGMTVTGDNPWSIDTHEYDVKLRAVWDPKAQVVKLVVTAGKGGYFGMVTCDEIWKKIDPILKGVIDVA